MHAYKTQNVTFDVYEDCVSIRSQEYIFATIGNILSKALPIQSKVITAALDKEQLEHGVSIVNGTLVCHTNFSCVTSRKTLFVRMSSPLYVDFGQGPSGIDFIACTVGPKHLGALNLRYLSRLTRLFSDTQLTENLKAVNSVDGMRLLLDDNKSPQKWIAA